MCDSVCVFMQMKFVTLFVALGWQKALTLGSFSVNSQTEKFTPFILQGQYLSLDKILILSAHLGSLFLQLRRLLNKEL